MLTRYDWSNSPIQAMVLASFKHLATDICLMHRCLVLITTLLLSACATFDRTNILPGQRVPGPALSFAVPTQNTWFAVEYGTGNRIKLSQLNNEDRYSIIVAINKGPFRGMYNNAEDHLKDLQRFRNSRPQPSGLIEHSHKDWIDTRYGKLCVRSASFAEDWRGRNSKGPAMVESIQLVCAHPELINVLVSTQLTRRSEKEAKQVDLSTLADELFASFEFKTYD